MLKLLPLLFLFAGPFWLKPAKQWTDEELDGFFKASPWTQTDDITVFFATAQPMRDAEYELRRRRGEASAEFGHDSDFDEFLKTRGAEHIVIAVRQKDQTGLVDPAEMKRLERDSRIKTGKRYLKLEGIFPPAPGDTLLRLVFPRDLDPKDTRIRLELYIPALDGKAYRTFEFLVQDLMVNGKLEI